MDPGTVELHLHRSSFSLSWVTNPRSAGKPCDSDYWLRRHYLSPVIMTIMQAQRLSQAEEQVKHEQRQAKAQIDLTVKTAIERLKKIRQVRHLI